MKRIWIFGSLRSFTSEEEQNITEELTTFITDWNAHGQALSATFELLENRFIKVSADERKAQASGCSIDSLTHLIQKLEKEQGLQLLDRMSIFYKQGTEIISQKLPIFKKELATKSLQSDIMVYNLGVATEKDFQKSFCLPITDSWASRFLVATS